MVIRKTSALVEAAILAAIAVIFTLAGEFIPVLGMFTNLFWPLPIILCGRRNGLKWSILCLLVTAAIIAMLVGPFTALTTVLLLGIIGLAMGEGMRRNMSPGKILLVGTAASMVSLVLSIAAGYFLLHVDVLKNLTESLEQSFSMSMDLYKKMGIPLTQMAEMQAQMQAIIAMMKISLPAILFLSAPITVLINYWGARKILSRMGEYYPWFPPFAKWQMPKTALLPYLLAIALLFLMRERQTHVLYILGYNLFIFFNVILVVNALSVIYWYTTVKKNSKGLFYLGLFLVFFSQLFSQLAVIVGAYDIIFDFRKLRKKPIEDER